MKIFSKREIKKKLGNGYLLKVSNHFKILELIFLIVKEKEVTKIIKYPHYIVREYIFFKFMYQILTPTSLVNSKLKTAKIPKLIFSHHSLHEKLWSCFYLFHFTKSILIINSWTLLRISMNIRKIIHWTANKHKNCHAWKQWNILCNLQKSEVK